MVMKNNRYFDFRTTTTEALMVIIFKYFIPMRRLTSLFIHSCMDITFVTGCTLKGVAQWNKGKKVALSGVCLLKRGHLSTRSPRGFREQRDIIT